MRIEKLESNQAIAVINGRELLPALISLEGIKSRMEHTTMGLADEELNDSILQLQLKQERLDELNQSGHELNFQQVSADEMEARLDAAVLRMGLEGVLRQYHVKKGKERRLVRKMVKTLQKANVT